MRKKETEIVRYQLDTENPPPLTKKQRAELAALAVLPEDQIDYSDIPPLTDEMLAALKSRKRA